MAITNIYNKKSRGSLIPLSLGFFLISMCLLFVSINISSAYSVKKELTNIGEAAINKAAQSINLPAYYAQLNQFSSSKRNKASKDQRFSRSILSEQFFNSSNHVLIKESRIWSFKELSSIFAAEPITNFSTNDCSYGSGKK